LPDAGSDLSGCRREDGGHVGVSIRHFTLTALAIHRIEVLVYYREKVNALMSFRVRMIQEQSHWLARGVIVED
jgi:hypothetical protein